MTLAEMAFMRTIVLAAKFLRRLTDGETNDFSAALTWAKAKLDAEQKAHKIRRAEAERKSAKRGDK